MNKKPQSTRAALGGSSSYVNTELIIYGLILFCSSGVFGLLLRSILDHPATHWASRISQWLGPVRHRVPGISYLVEPIAYLVSIAYWAVPVLCWGLIVFRVRLFESLIPASVLCCVAVIGMVTGTGVLTPYGRLIALVAIATIGAATRYQTLATSQSNLIASSRINYTPTSKVRSVSNNWSFGHFCSIPLIVIAWIAGGILCRDLVAFSSRTSYVSVYNRLNAETGLLPEWNAGIRTLLVLTFMLWLGHKVFGYFQLRQGDGSVAAMHLRSELWKWNGWEQRTISKQLQKIATANKQQPGE